ncbi:hypothetical protein FJT64_026577 [Amphibalanus amphitrite]|uniref:Uncharacterized protein n=1 Tax=Amphibalanus amphitrite TaxID=1232801 RepID=A0A6A4WGD1_AMPAM|nr:hypothetical protein FJT64_026577 [Amphibalanus amphitrite]
MAETFVARARGPAMDPSEVETFDPATGPGRSEFEPVPEKPRTKWREVADPRTVHSLDPDVYSTKKSKRDTLPTGGARAATAVTLRPRLAAAATDE